MREIEFRGVVKNVDTPKKRWVHGYDCKVEGKAYIIFDDAEIETDDFYQETIAGFVEVVPETVGQYTGLKDKNGQKIYEGDIVEFNVVNPIWDEEKQEYKEHRPETWRRAVYYKAPKFWIHWYPERLEVIGNIYENPELRQENDK